MGVGYTSAIFSVICIYRFISLTNTGFKVIGNCSTLLDYSRPVEPSGGNGKRSLHFGSNVGLRTFHGWVGSGVVGYTWCRGPTPSVGPSLQ